MKTWILVVMISGSPNAIPGFHDDWACKAAGVTIAKEVGKDTKYWCFATS